MAGVTSTDGARLRRVVSSSAVRRTGSLGRFSVSAMLRVVWLDVIVRALIAGGLLAERCELETAEPFFLTEQLLSQIRHHRVLPDQLDPLVVEIVAKEVAWADGAVPIAEPFVGCL